MIESQLRNLINMPLANSGRVSDMIWFSFGKQRQTTNSRGKEKTVGEYALHVQCAWRLVGPEGILIGSNDIYFPARTYLGVASEFNWDLPGANWCDQKIEEIILRRPSPLYVEAIQADSLGGARIQMVDGLALEIFPSGSATVEYWRLFKPGVEGSHFMVNCKS